MFDRRGAAAAIATRMAERDISLESIVQRRRPARSAKTPGAVPVILITYATYERTIREALEAVVADGFLAAKAASHPHRARVGRPDARRCADGMERVAMNGLRGAILSLFGLMVAIAAALVVLPIACLLDPVTRQAAAAFAHFAFFSLAKSPAVAVSEMARFAWTAIVAVCVVPLAITVLIGAVARVHSLLWYVGATGSIAALAPWVARAAVGTVKAVSASSAELRFAFVFFLTGAASGFVFWLLAGRNQEARSQRAD